MVALRYIVWVSLGLGSARAQTVLEPPPYIAPAHPCPELGGVEALPPLAFLVESSDGSQRQSALLPPTVRLRWSFLQVSFVEGELSLANRLPGLGLPYSLYHVRWDHFDLQGRPHPELSGEWPEAGRCESLGLFPGQQSPRIKTFEGRVLPGRLVVHVWASLY